jgi:hypothetical protein
MTTPKRIKEARALVKAIDTLKELEDLYLKADDDDLARACIRRGLDIICPKTISDMKLSKTEEELEVAYANFNNEQDWLRQSVVSDRYAESEGKKIDKVDDLYYFYVCKFLEKKIKIKLTKLGLCKKDENHVRTLDMLLIILK